MSGRLLKAWQLMLLGFLTLGASQCSVKQVKDADQDNSKLHAFEAGEKTAAIQGCGNQPVLGYTFCYKTDGASASEEIIFIAPITSCPNDSCARVTVFFPNQQPSIARSFPKDECCAKLQWKEILKKDHFQVSDRGFWPVLIEYDWVDENGNLHTTPVEGEIRLRVLPNNYVSLRSSEASRYFVWESDVDGHPIKYTTKGRAYIANQNQAVFAPLLEGE